MRIGAYIDGGRTSGRDDDHARCGGASLRIILIAGIAACLLSFVSIAQTTAQATRPNKALFDEACRMAADSLILHTGIGRSSTVQARCAGSEHTQFFRSVLMDAVTSAAGTVDGEGTSADTIISFFVEDVQVAFGDSFRERWLGEKKTERTVLAAVRLEMQLLSTGKILYTGTVRRSVSDTIAVDEIARVSASARHIATGDAPEATLWEKILEPAILTVSSGIAVYLFFTVRS
jgi:hypothetical protein